MITIRNRHQSRLCHVCGAPMARQTDHCGKCEAVWAHEPRAAVRRLSLRESTTHVRAVRARRNQDSVRRDRRPASRTAVATTSKGA
jgi:hypothetical protein